MKRILLLLLCTTTLGLVSCKKDNIIQDTPNRTIILTIHPNDWVKSTNGDTYTATLQIPEIDRINVDVEGILVYLDHPVNVNSYIQLPYVFGGNSYSYEQFYDNSKSSGIAIDIQRSEYSTQNPKKPDIDIRVKVVLIPSMDVT